MAKAKKMLSQLQQNELVEMKSALIYFISQMSFKAESTDSCFQSNLANLTVDLFNEKTLIVHGEFLNEIGLETDTMAFDLETYRRFKQTHSTQTIKAG